MQKIPLIRKNTFIACRYLTSWEVPVKGGARRAGDSRGAERRTGLIQRPKQPVRAQDRREAECRTGLIQPTNPRRQMRLKVGRARATCWLLDGMPQDTRHARAVPSVLATQEEP